MTRNAVDAFKKWGKNEPGFEKTLKRMEADAKGNVPGKFSY